MQILPTLPALCGERDREIARERDRQTDRQTDRQITTQFACFTGKKNKKTEASWAEQSWENPFVPIYAVSMSGIVLLC